MKKIVLTVCVFCAAACAHASVVGLWQTIDDESGKPKSVVSVYEENGQIFGKIIFTYNEEGRPNITKTATGAAECDTSVKAQNMDGQPPYCNLVIIKNLKPAKDGKYKGGTITDPKKNKTYDSEMWLKDGNLIVRGKIAFLGRNQTWRPFTQQQLDAVLTK